MLKINEEQLDSIRDQLATATPTAVGYRLMVKPIPARKGMEGAEAAKFEKLAAAGFVTKTDNQESKESHGSDIGVVVHVGPDTYKIGNMSECSNWVEVGDVVIIQRYAGHRAELPPGSGEFYHFINDDDVFGKYEGIEV